jgi:hypothetical protein
MSESFSAVTCPRNSHSRWKYGAKSTARRVPQTRNGATTAEAPEDEMEVLCCINRTAGIANEEWSYYSRGA